MPILATAGWTLQRIAEIQSIDQILLPSPFESASELDLYLPTTLANQVSQVRQEATSFPCVSIDTYHVTSPSQYITEATDESHTHKTTTLQHDKVAVGGTFDRLHAGHRLILAVAALVCRETVYLGMAADKLLANKAGAKSIFPFEQRSAEARAFIEAFKPGLRVEVSALVDPKEAPKAATMSAITALVVSIETESGGQVLQKMRSENGITDALELIPVGLVGADQQTADAPKLSSSFLREQEQRRPS